MTKKTKAIKVDKISCIYCKKSFTDECDSETCLTKGVSKYFGHKLMPFNMNYSLFEPKEVKDESDEGIHESD
jgi:hypothetical protein